MRTTVDIPDPLYRQLKARAALEGTTIKKVLMGLVQRELAGRTRGHSVSFPLIRGKETRRLNLTNEQIDQILFG
jgi:hypothetical protein